MSWSLTRTTARLPRTWTRNARSPEWVRHRWTLAGSSPASSAVTTAIIPIAGAAALGVALVVYGMVFPQRAAASPEGLEPRVTYGTLAEVREQLRRRFDPTGEPAWIASDQWQTRLQRDLISADVALRPYEFRILQGISVLAFALIGILRFGFNPAFVV